MLWILLLGFLVMQLFGWLFAKGLLWLLPHSLSRTTRRAVWMLVFGIGNSLFFILFFHLSSILFRLLTLWLVVLLYGVLTMLAVWSAGWLLRLKWPPERTLAARRVLAAGLFSGLFALSLYNAYTPVVRHYAVRIGKPLDKPVRIGVASDLHLGALFGSRQIDELVRIMQRERVDIILLPGDLMDDNTEAYNMEHMQPHLQRLRAPLGVYATLGNHDLFGHQAEIAAALQEAGITVLHDSAANVDNRFWVLGRPDEMDAHRADTTDLLKQIDTARPVFLLDHRPTSITRHEQLPIDIQVSGHVHNGQIFPGNLVVKLLNVLSYGYEARGRGHYFVTSGYGFWGIPLRLGSQSEVVVIDVSGE